MARCKVADTDLSQAILEAGWAVIDPRYSDHYKAAQSLAKKQGHGAWAGEFMMPWEWRTRVSAD